MKIIKFIFQIVKWIIIAGILLFSLALVLNKSYLQTLIFLLIAATLAWWPKMVTRKWDKKVGIISRVGFLAILVLVKFFFLKSEPKTTIYTSEKNKETLMTVYDECCRDWPKNTEDIYIETNYGKCMFWLVGIEKTLHY